MKKDQEKKKRNLVAMVQTGTRVAGGVKKAVDITKMYLIPAALVVFAAVAYIVWDVNIPDE